MNVVRHARAVSTRLRFEVLKRDLFKCQYCGVNADDAVLHVDHVIAIANGGSNDPSNLVTACSVCNLGKSDVPLEKLAAPVSKAVDRECEAVQLALRHVQASKDREEIICQVALALSPKFKVGIGHNVHKAIANFIKSLGVDETLEAAQIAGRNTAAEDKFKYFCGVCWTKYRELNSREQVNA